jgi:photosystem II stability/assembly factor-like uncharacterized protein
MTIRPFLITGFLALLNLTGCAGVDKVPADLYAAMIMTKEQQASSIPTDSGVLRHDPVTGQWKRLGPQIQMISSAASDPTDPRVIFFACGNGIARSRDGGETWRLVTGWRESDVLQIVVDPTDPQRVYAATAWGVNLSTDGGDSWSAANEGLDEYFAKGIAIDQRDPARLLLANTKGLFESGDRAGSWRRVQSFPEVAVLRLRRGESDPDIWIAGTEGRGLWLSRDDGRSWSPAAPQLADANLYAVAVDPADASRMAAGGWGTGVHVSLDGGATWQAATGTLPSPNITAMIFDRATPGRLWVSTFEEGTFYSDDAGATWTDANLHGAYVFDLVYLGTP